MEYLFGILIFIVLLITSLIFIVVVPRHKYYFSNDTYPYILYLNELDNFNKIKNECSTINDTIIIFSNNVVDNNIISKLPNTYNLLRTIPDLRNAFLTVLKPKSKTTRHKGSADLSNHTLRCVLPICISSAKKSGVWVDGEKKLFKENEWIIYDNSRENNTFNTNKYYTTILLVIDIDRPSNVPIGVSSEITNRLL